MTGRRPHADVIADMAFLTERQRSELTWLLDGDLRDAAKGVAEWGAGQLDTLVSVGAGVVHGMPRFGPPVYGFVRDHYRAVFIAEAVAAAELTLLRRELEEAKEQIASLRSKANRLDWRLHAIRNLESSWDDDQPEHNGHQPNHGEPECIGCWYETVENIKAMAGGEP